MEEAIARRQPQVLPSFTGVREGRSYVVTSHGKPVARLILAGKHEHVAARARETLLAHLEKQPVIQAGRWSHDELYEDER
jgi:antitoxin (DNA-binding transcriptional repressor) of toxin-antitoxin stability system